MKTTTITIRLVPSDRWIRCAGAPPEKAAQIRAIQAAMNDGAIPSEPELHVYDSAGVYCYALR